CLRIRTRGLPIIYSPAAVLRSQPRSSSRARALFRRSAAEFAARWAPAPRSDELVCVADGRDFSREMNRAWRLPQPSAPVGSGLPAIVWTSYFLETGGYTEEAMSAVE